MTLSKIKWLFVVMVMLSVHLAMACDQALSQFESDCEIQDKYRGVQKKLEKYKLKDQAVVSIEQLSEYRALRFISKDDWSRAKSRNTPINEIYQPAPLTWQIWSDGIDRTLSSNEFDIKYLTPEQLIQIHSNVLTAQIQDKGTDLSTKGNLRKKVTSQVGYCHAISKYSNVEEELRKVQNDMNPILADLKKIMVDYVISHSDSPVSEEDFHQLKPVLSVMYSDSQSSFCQKGKSDSKYLFVRYAPAEELDIQLKIWFSFVKKVRQSFDDNNPMMSPIAFAAIAQKWFVTLHPFSDGNGRTSRAIQELILQEFDLPKVPAGYLQADATVLASDYVKDNYKQISAMLSRMSSCASSSKINKDYSCKVLKKSQYQQ